MAGPPDGRLPPAVGRDPRQPKLVEAQIGAGADAGSIPAASIAALGSLAMGTIRAKPVDAGLVRKRDDQSVRRRGFNWIEVGTLPLSGAGYGRSMHAPSASSSRVRPERRLQELDEKHFAEIDVAMLYIEEARERTERAMNVLRAEGADAHLVEALERSATELSEVARRLRQGTLFAVPKEQLNL
jgi:hypothetical protein